MRRPPSKQRALSVWSPDGGVWQSLSLSRGGAGETLIFSLETHMSVNLFVVCFGREVVFESDRLLSLHYYILPLRGDVITTNGASEHSDTATQLPQRPARGDPAEIRSGAGVKATYAMRVTI